MLCSTIAVVLFYAENNAEKVCKHFRTFNNYDFHSISSKL